jgi:hypothetical protein
VSEAGLAFAAKRLSFAVTQRRRRRVKPWYMVASGEIERPKP